MKKIFIFIFIVFVALSSCNVNRANANRAEKEMKRESVELLELLLKDPYTYKLDEIKLYDFSFYSSLCEAKAKTYREEYTKQEYLDSTKNPNCDYWILCGAENGMNKFQNACDSVKDNREKNSVYFFYELTYHAKNGFGLMTIGRFYTIYRIECFADGGFNYETKRMVAIAYDELPKLYKTNDYDFSEIELIKSDDFFLNAQAYDAVNHLIFEKN